MFNLSEHFNYRRSAMWIAAGACLVVLGWRMCVLASQFLGGHSVTSGLAHVFQFEQDLSPNNANTRLVFCQDTEDGVGIYFCNAAGGKPRLLCEQKEKGHSWQRFTMLGWSPDDSLLAVAWPDAGQDKEFILIFNGNTGEPEGKVGAEQHLEQLAWLSGDSFVYCTQKDVGLVTSTGKNHWQHQHFFTDLGTNIDTLTAVSANTVAWQDGGSVWRFDLDTGATTNIWHGMHHNLVDFTYSKPADEYLLNLRDGHGQYLVRYNATLTNGVNLEHIGPWYGYVRRAAWDSQGTSYAYLSNELGVSVLCLKTPDAAAPVNVAWHGGAASLILKGQHAYFQGNGDGQSPAIWDYDLKSQSFREVMAASDNPLDKVIALTPTFGEFTNSLGEQRFYHLWAPSHVVPGRKYPVLLGQELNTWFPFFQVAADNGFYVAVADRPFFHVWNEPHRRTTTEDVDAMYQIMAANPNIDTNRMYLYACSWETTYLSGAIKANPGRWKGAIMFTPINMPDRPLLTDKSIMVVDGAVDADMAKKLPIFQDETAHEGGVVTLYIQNDAGHDAASGGTERRRAGEFAKFLEQQR
jgi:hypothetical protein